MERLPSPEELDALFALADLGVRTGLAGQPAPEIDPVTLLPALREPAGVFVTLEVAGELNGCIGSVVPAEPLGATVPRLAFAAAFADPRLPALTEGDYESLEIKLSLIGPLIPVPATSEAQVLAHVRPGIDGLMIVYGAANATFLPAVWARVPDPLVFLRQLEIKAGLRPGRWPAGMRAWRYEAMEHRRRATDIPDRRSAA